MKKKNALFIMLTVVMALCFSTSAMAINKNAQKSDSSQYYVEYDLISGTKTRKKIFIPQSFYSVNEYSKPATEGNNNLGVPIYDPVDDLPITRGYDPDSWKKVTNTKVTPYMKIAYLVINFKSGTQTGTGFMIESGKILTSAHCLYNSHSGHIGETPTSIDVYFGRNGSYSYSYLNCKANSFKVNSEYADNSNEDYDYGIITVDKSVSDKTGTFGWSTSIDEDATYTLTGYPYDSKKYYGKVMYTDSGSVGPVWSKSFDHSLNSCGGVSGGPIYNSSNQVIGIHSRSTSSKGGTATRFTSDVRALIKQ